MSDTVRKQIGMRVAEHLASQPWVAGADYARRFDATRETPWCWVYDFAEEYGVESMTFLFNKLSLGTATSYAYTDEKPLVDAGNDVLGYMLRDVMLLNDETYRGALNFSIVPVESAFVDQSPEKPNIGALVMGWEVQYQYPFANPWSQEVP